MISITHLTVVGPATLLISFSDDSSGEWNADDVLKHDTVLTRPLTDPAYFARAFIENGDSLAWPNGLELSARALHRTLEESGKLIRRAA